MTATVKHTTPSAPDGRPTPQTERVRLALARLLRPAQRAFLRYRIWETEHWIADCERDGIFDGVSLRYVRADLAQMRVRLALLED